MSREEQATINTSPVESESSPEVFRISSNAFNYIIVAAVFLILGVLLGLNLNSDDSDEIRTVVRDAVADQMAGLESVIASASLGVDEETLQELIASAVADAGGQADDYYVDDDPFQGPEDAPVVMVEFSDFYCGFCGRHFEQTLQPLIENYGDNLRYVYRDFPGVGGELAVQAAMAANCAAEQDAFWDYHGYLFGNQDTLGADSISGLNNTLVSHAETLGLDGNVFRECLESDKYRSEVLRDRADGQQLGLQGTPGFFINGIFVSGAQPYANFAQIIDAELSRLGIES